MFNLQNTSFTHTLAQTFKHIYFTHTLKECGAQLNQNDLQGKKEQTKKPIPNP